MPVTRDARQNRWERKTRNTTISESSRLKIFGLKFLCFLLFSSPDVVVFAHKHKNLCLQALCKEFPATNISAERTAHTHTTSTLINFVLESYKKIVWDFCENFFPKKTNSFVVFGKKSFFLLFCFEDLPLSCIFLIFSGVNTIS